MKRVSQFLVFACLMTMVLSSDGSLAVAKPPPPHPEVFITRAYAQEFPVPYGHGLKMEYYYDLRLDEAPWRKAISITTQYSPDGTTWTTDEEARPPGYRWDNIHGNVRCGPTKYNLASNHLYALRVILNYDDGGVVRERVSNTRWARVRDYAELCVEHKIAEKFMPVLHRHPDDLQPEGLVDVDSVTWKSRKVFNSSGQEYPDGKITKHSEFHWQYKYYWDTWGLGQSPAFFRWDMEDAEWYRVEPPGGRPLYYHVYKSGPSYYLQYWYFMTMNDIRVQTNENTWHEGDFEHVSIEIEKIGDRFVPRRVNFYKHEGGSQYPASECYWGKSASGFDMKVPPKKGYDEVHTHLHVWIARNAHASYNYKEPLYQLDVAGEVYRDDVDYDPDPWTDLYETFFRYDLLVNMGEIAQSPDSDGDGYINAHGWEWFDHVYHVPAWDDLQWLPFRGRLGTFWCKKPDGTIATFVLLFKSICTPSPRSPAWGGHWLVFEDNVDCGGFGNRDTNYKDYKWVDPDTGEVVCDSGR